MLTGSALVILCDTLCKICGIKEPKLKVYAFIITALLSQFNVSVLFKDTFAGFYPMTLGVSFYILSISYCLKMANSDLFDVSKFIKFIISIICTALVYSEIIPFFILQVISLIVYFLISKNKSRIKFIKQIFFTGFISVIFLNMYIIGMIKAIIMEMKDKVGQYLNYDILTYAGYLFGVIPANFSFKNKIEYPILRFLSIIFILLLIILCVYSFRRLRINIEGKKQYIVLCIPYIIMIGYFLFFAPNLWIEGTGNSYSVYKTYHYLMMILIPMIAILLSSLLVGSNRAIKTLIIGYCIYLVVFGSLEALNMMQNSKMTHVSTLENENKPFDDFYKLRKTYSNSDNTINLINFPPEYARLITYFLKECQIAYDYKDDIFFRKYVETSPAYQNDGIYLLFDLEDNRVIKIKEIDIEKYYEIQLVDGFYADETDKDGNVFNWAQKRSKIKVIQFGNKDKMKISFDIGINQQYQNDVLRICDASNGNIIKKINIGKNMKERIELEIPFNYAPEKGIELFWEGEMYDPLDNANLDLRELAFVYFSN